MEPRELDDRIRSLEPLARRRPGLFRLRVVLLALAGYGYLLAFPAVLLGLLTWIHPRLLLLGVPLLLLIGYALWVRLPAPEGVEVPASDAPRLYRSAEEFRRKLQYPHFHRLLLDEEFNAGVIQIPWLGLLGWERNYLRVGLPLLLGLSPEQFQAVLAHEFCHLFGAHNRFSRWAHRLDQTWETLMDGLEQNRSWATYFFRPFARWYVPQLRAHALALMRTQEFDADNFAADMVGRSVLAETLVAIEVKYRYLSEVFWPEVWRGSETAPEPPEDPFLAMASALRDLPVPDRGQRWLDRALAEETPVGASHPSLTERLRAVNESPRLPAPLALTAAEHFLGASARHLSAAVTAHWRQSVRSSWQEQHEKHRRMLSRRAELTRRAEAGEISAPEAWELASFIERTRGAREAEPYLRLVLERDAEHPGASFLLGRQLLEAGDNVGEEMIELAMRLDSDLVLPGCELLYNLHLDRGDREGARAWHYRALKHQEVWVLAQKERFGVTPRDRFYSAPLSGGQRSALARVLHRFRQVAAAYFVRKEVRYLPDKPCYVLALDWRRLYPVWGPSALLERILAEVGPLLPPALLISLQDVPRLRNRIRNVPGACVYRRRWGEADPTAAEPNDRIEV
jgi:Zn-dependent protease with chaperone function